MNQIDCIQCGGIKNASQMQYKLCNHCMKENKKKKVLKNNTTALFCSGCNNVVTTPGLCKKCLDRGTKNREKDRLASVPCRGIIEQGDPNQTRLGERCRNQMDKEANNGFCQKHKKQAIEYLLPPEDTLCTYRNSCEYTAEFPHKWCSHHLECEKQKYQEQVIKKESVASPK